MEQKKTKRSKPTSKKHKFVKDGLFYAELNDFLGKELAEESYAGCEVRVTPKTTEIIIHANKTLEVVGKQGRRIRELKSLIEKRFQFKKGSVDIYVMKIKNRGLSALSQAEAVRYRLFDGLSVRRACYSVLKWIMDRGAKGCEVVVSGKLRGQRAKSMKFREGYMVSAGFPCTYYIDTAVKHVHLRQGVLGIKVKIMLPHKDDKGGGDGIEKQLPDTVKILDPKDIASTKDQMERQKKQLGTLTFKTNMAPLGGGGSRGRGGSRRGGSRGGPSGGGGGTRGGPTQGGPPPQQRFDQRGPPQRGQAQPAFQQYNQGFNRGGGGRGRGGRGGGRGFPQFQ